MNTPRANAYAHSRPDLPQERWHALEDHLHGTAKQASDFAQKFRSAKTLTIKILTDEGCADEDAKTRFLREAKLAAKLDTAHRRRTCLYFADLRAGLRDSRETQRAVPAEGVG